MNDYQVKQRLLKQELKAEAKEIERLIRAYKRRAGCGDPQCDTCKVSVAIGLRSLDRAYEAGIAEAEHPVA